MKILTNYEFLNKYYSKVSIIGLIVNLAEKKVLSLLTHFSKIALIL